MKYLTVDGEPIRVYVSGPMSNGNVYENCRKGIGVGEEIFNLGFIPFVPHLSVLWNLYYDHSWEEWLGYDEEWVKVCHVTLRMDGESPGADREVNLSEKLHRPIFYSVKELVSWAKSLPENIE